MDQRKFEAACGATLRLLNEGFENLGEPRRDPEYNPFAGLGPAHLHWMLVQAPLFYAEGKTEKANRWLGYVQGVMRCDKLATLEQLKRANMPDGETYDGSRV